MFPSKQNRQQNTPQNTKLMSIDQYLRPHLLLTCCPCLREENANQTLKKKTETVALNGWFPSPSILGHVTSLGLSFFHCKMDVLGVCSAYPARSLGECWNTWDSPLGMSLVLLLSATSPPRGSVHIPQQGRWTAGSPQLT